MQYTFRVGIELQRPVPALPQSSVDSVWWLFFASQSQIHLLSLGAPQDIRLLPHLQDNRVATCYREGSQVRRRIFWFTDRIRFAFSASPTGSYFLVDFLNSLGALTSFCKNCFPHLHWTENIPLPQSSMRSWLLHLPLRRRKEFFLPWGTEKTDEQKNDYFQTTNKKLWKHQNSLT